MSDATIIGLGPMGFALVDLLLKAGRQVSLWNRSAGKTQPLVERGASLASTPADAIAASPVTVICVYDYAAVDAILSTDGAATALRDRLIINIGTGGPEEARHIEAHVERHGGRYLDGAIQAAPSQMGRDDTPLFVSGKRPDFDEARTLLGVFAGNVVYLGDKIDAAAYMDLATLSFVYGSFSGFLHGANLARETGIDVATYGALVNAISPSFGAFYQHEGNVIAAGDFRATESPLRISIPAVRRILRTSVQLGINAEVPALMDRWLTAADEAGLADQEVAVLIKVLRGEVGAP